MERENTPEIPLTELTPSQAAKAVDAGLAHPLNNIINGVVLANELLGPRWKEIISAFRKFTIPHGKESPPLSINESLEPAEAAKRRALFWLNQLGKKFNKKKEPFSKEDLSQWKDEVTSYIPSVPPITVGETSLNEHLLNKTEEVDRILTGLLNLAHQGIFPPVKPYTGSSFFFDFNPRQSL